MRFLHSPIALFALLEFSPMSAQKAFLHSCTSLFVFLTFDIAERENPTRKDVHRKGSAMVEERFLQVPSRVLQASSILFLVVLLGHSAGGIDSGETLMLSHGREPAK